MSETMKAVICPKYSTADVLIVKEVARPTPKDDEVLVKICASSINAYDWHKMSADILMIRFAAGFFKPKANLGCDIAGRVEEIGKNVKTFKVGDEVFGCMADQSGDSAYAEYVCAKESILAHKPANATFEQAAAVPMAAVTALQGLRLGQVQAGQSILINGASGGVGTFAVQIAKALGANVTGVCSRRNLKMVHSIGADTVIDYSRDDFTKNGQQYDLIIDNVISRSLKDLRNSLNPNGICVVVGFSGTRGIMRRTLKIMLGGKSKAKRHQGKKIVLLMANNMKGSDLEYLRGLIEAERVMPIIDATYSLDKITKAFWHYNKEHPKGKIVIKISE